MGTRADVATRLTPHRDDDFCYLTTRGRTSGRPHEIEIWFALDGATLYLLAGAGDRADWVRNLVAEPAVTVRVGATTYSARARVVAPETAEDVRARTLVFAKYSPAHADLEGWRERALPVAVDVRAPATDADPHDQS